MRTLEQGGAYALPEFFAGPAQMPIRIFEGLVLDLGRVFEGI
jgi:hypothetical protein